MNKTELIAAVAAKTGEEKSVADKNVNAVLSTIMDTLVAGDKVQVIGFGTFEVKERAARKGKNPQTGETIDIAASKSAGFKAGKALKDALNA